MTKRYREVVSEVQVTPAGGAGNDVPAVGAPLGFTWRERQFRVTRVLGHWREDPGWWRPGGEGGRTVRIEQSDLWRVEARAAGAAAAGGVYELVHRGGQWRLDRVWD